MYSIRQIKAYDGCQMRVQYKELMEKVGVGTELSPYETRPWLMYDPDQAITCSAEVRVGPGGEDVELEIQFLYDEMDERYADDAKYGEPEQIIMMRFEPNKEQIWSEKIMVVKGEDYSSKLHDWGDRGCEFFYACIGAIQMDELPDIDELIETILTDSSRTGRGGRKGRVGKKGFKMDQKPIPMMGVKP